VRSQINLSYNIKLNNYNQNSCWDEMDLTPESEWTVLSPPEVNLHGGRHNTRGGAHILSPPEVNLHGGRHDTRGGGQILCLQKWISQPNIVSCHVGQIIKGAVDGRRDHDLGTHFWVRTLHHKCSGWWWYHFLMIDWLGNIICIFNMGEKMMLKSDFCPSDKTKISFLLSWLSNLIPTCMVRLD
jgi:hypothetical protein